MMTNEPKVELTEKDHSQTLEERIQEAWDRFFYEEDAKMRHQWDLVFGNVASDTVKLLQAAGKVPRVMSVSTPNSPIQSFGNELRQQYKHKVWEEVHDSKYPVTKLHSWQRATVEAMLRDPLHAAKFNACGGITLMHVCYEHDDALNIGHTPMALRSLRNGIRPWTEEVHFPYIGYTGFEDQFESAHDSVFIEDRYFAPTKKRKNWDKSGMGGKHRTNLAVAAHRASKKNIYSPEFNWQDQHEARRKLHYIKHVNVGTAGHIDWGSNRMLRSRPYLSGHLAACVRKAIQSL